MSDNQDMATMPVPELVQGIRNKIERIEDPLTTLVLGVLSGRLMKEYERAEHQQKQLADREVYLAKLEDLVASLQARIDRYNERAASKDKI